MQNSFSAATIISIISRKCHVCWSGSSHALAHDLHRMLYVNCHQSAAQVPRTRASTAWRLWSHRAWPKLLKDSTKKGTDQQQQHIDQPSWNMKGCERRRNLVEILLPEKWPPQICLIEAPLGIIASLRLWWLNLSCTNIIDIWPTNVLWSHYHPKLANFSNTFSFSRLFISRPTCALTSYLLLQQYNALVF